MDYDLCVIGAGWAGFNAALSASKLAKKVCLAEARDLGGVCLNRGCIPTKALVQYSRQGLPFSEIQRKKDEVVRRLKTGLASLVKSADIDYFECRAGIDADGYVTVGADKKIRAEYILIATGSEPKDLPGLKFDHQKILSSDDVLNLESVPKNILVIGGGFIGCELACIFRRLGSDVTIVEITQQLMPGLDGEVSRRLQQYLQKAGISVVLGRGAEGAALESYDKIFLSVGRRSIVEGAGGGGLDLKIDKEHISVDRELRTSNRRIFAAGDCIGGYLLAHVAAYEGQLAVNNMFLKPEKRDYSAVPSSVFTTPEVASIGLSEEEARNFGVAYKAGVVHFLSVGMAHILGSTEGFAKVLVEERTGRILGAAVIGVQSTELINVFSILMKNDIPVSGLQKTIFAHPSVSEIITEVAKTFA